MKTFGHGFKNYLYINLNFITCCCEDILDLDFTSLIPIAKFNYINRIAAIEYIVM